MTTTFTTSNTLNEIIRQAGREMCLFFSPAFLSFIPEEYWDIPLSQWAENYLMPWGLPFPMAQLLENANMLQHADEYWDWMPLWTDDAGLTLNTNDANSVALMIPKGQPEGVCPAVIICPGGAYEELAFYNEGYLTARRMQEAGYRTFVLNYRYSPNRWPIPQVDLACAIQHVRANAERYQIMPDNLMILGYSAGGHLCASTAALWREIAPALREEIKACRPELVETYGEIPIRPDKVCLGYPVISFGEEAHERSFQNLSGGDESLREHLSIEKQVRGDYPKTFVWACADDSMVPASNAVRMDQALTEQNVPHKFHLYPTGEHGCYLAIGTSAEGWVDEMLAFMK